MATPFFVWRPRIKSCFTAFLKNGEAVSSRTSSATKIRIIRGIRGQKKVIAKQLAHPANSHLIFFTCLVVAMPG